MRQDAELPLQRRLFRGRLKGDGPRHVTSGKRLFYTTFSIKRPVRSESDERRTRPDFVPASPKTGGHALRWLNSAVIPPGRARPFCLLGQRSAHDTPCRLLYRFASRRPCKLTKSAYGRRRNIDRDNRVAAIDSQLSKTPTPRLRFIAWFAALFGSGIARAPCVRFFEFGSEITGTTSDSRPAFPVKCYARVPPALFDCSMNVRHNGCNCNRCNRNAICFEAMSKPRGNLWADVSRQFTNYTVRTSSGQCVDGERSIGQLRESFKVVLHPPSD